MTKEEMTQVINTILNIYPNFMYGRNLKEVCKAWYSIMHDQDYKKVMKKLNAWIAENEKPPLPCNLITVDWKKSYEHQLND